MNKLWTVEVVETYTLVVWAANVLEAEQVAQNHAHDSVEPEVELISSELRHAHPIPEGWADSEPYADDIDALYEVFEGEDGRAAGLTVGYILQCMEKRGRKQVERCENTPDMFVDDSTKLTDGRHNEGEKA